MKIPQSDGLTINEFGRTRRLEVVKEVSRLPELGEVIEAGPSELKFFRAGEGLQVGRSKN